MSLFSAWWRQDRTQVFAKLVVKAAMIFLGSVANDTYQLCLKCVKNVESVHPNLPGIDKFVMVQKAVLEELHGIYIPKYLINLLIEAAVTVAKEELKKDD